MRRLGPVVSDVVRSAQDRGLRVASVQAAPPPKQPAAGERNLLHKWKLLGLVQADPKMTGRGPSAAAWVILDAYDRRRRVHEISFVEIAERANLSVRGAFGAVQKLLRGEYFLVISGGLEPDGSTVRNRYLPNWRLLDDG